MYKHNNMSPLAVWTLDRYMTPLIGSNSPYSLQALFIHLLVKR